MGGAFEMVIREIAKKYFIDNEGGLTCDGRFVDYKIGIAVFKVVEKVK